MIHTERMTATIEGDFVLFLIGMRFNQPWKVHQWLPVVLSMGRRASAAGRLGRLGASSACPPSSFQELDHD